MTRPERFSLDMKRTRMLFAVAAAAITPLVATAPSHAEPDAIAPPPAPPVAAVSDNPLIPLPPVPPQSIIDTAALPLNDQAHWLPVQAWTWASPYLTGVEVCSPFGKPDPAGVEGADGIVSQPPAGDTQHTLLAPGENGSTEGWTATLSFTPYRSLNDSIGALHSYKRYLEACPLVKDESQTENDAGVARNDPTLAHGLLVTDGFYLDVFVAATETGVIELAFTQPTETPQVGLAYNPSAVFAALRGAHVRGPEIGAPEPLPAP